jgi:cytochrome c peroxidase
MRAPSAGRGSWLRGRSRRRLVVAWLLIAGASLALLHFVPGVRRKETRHRALPVPLRGPAAAQRTSLNAPPSAPPSAAPSDAPESPRVTLGRRIFFDVNLSEPPGTSCASCHDPSHGYAGNHGSTNGLAAGSRPGRFARRNTPSVLYLRFVRRFHLKYDDEDEMPEAFGGFFWDGRADTVAAVAPQPLLNPNEMGNRNARELAQKLARSDYAVELRREFDGVFDSPEKTSEALGFCVEAFLTSPALSPFSSKFDDYVRGRATLSPLETGGLALFQDLERGACSACHRLDTRSPLPESSLFTDFGYDTVAVPRNRRAPAGSQPRPYDLGVCEQRQPKWHREDPWFCGAFRTPSLRNVALRRSFMHNGVFSSLREVMNFYSTRATNPERWYPNATFDDLPAEYQANVNSTLPPYNRPRGDPALFDDAEIDALIAFLETLTDRAIPGAADAGSAPPRSSP